jgi:hypothetical protein
MRSSTVVVVVVVVVGGSVLQGLHGFSKYGG